MERLRKSKSSNSLHVSSSNVIMERFESTPEWEAEAGGSQGSQRLIIVANRLPVTCSKDPSGQWRLQVGEACVGLVCNVSFRLSIDLGFHALAAACDGILSKCKYKHCMDRVIELHSPLENLHNR